MNLWNCGELNPSAESSCKEIYMLSTLFCLNSEILKCTKYFRTDSFCFGEESGHSLPYPDNIMPRLIYRKSMRETLAEAYAKARARSFIPKYGDCFEVNFAINI